MPAPTQTDKVRFYGKVPLPDANGCIFWTGKAYRNGYGKFERSRTYGRARGTTAHRFAFELINGPLRSDHVVCHFCDNRLCCAPEHLWPGTQGENLRDMVEKGRGRKVKSLRCDRGHERKPRTTTGALWCPTRDRVRRSRKASA